mgnify:CR=1 FL=1
MHIGYCISCYSEKSYVFSAPISATRDDARKVLDRKFMINGEPLTEDQVKALRVYAIGEIEIGWEDNLKFYLEGHNLPDDEVEWV